MAKSTDRSQVVFTNKARCRDCYRCLRACPVKAIRMENGQAYVVEERCIACGTCIRECPQQAKSFRDDIGAAAQIVAQGGLVAASIAPSYVAAWNEEAQRRLPAALRKLGFSFVAETAVGAYHVARKTAECAQTRPNQSHIATACPAVVRYVEQYAADLVHLLTPIASPMIAHARHLKSRLGPDARVVFIGPCVAKKAEAESTAANEAVDCVLTFSELDEWLGRAGVRIEECPEGPFDEMPAGEARYFPVPGGLARTGGLQTGLLDTQCLAVSGVNSVEEALNDLRASSFPVVLEALFCDQGCVSGPGMPSNCRQNTFRRRSRVIDHARHSDGRHPVEPAWAEDVLHAHHAAAASECRELPADEAIQRVLERAGKGREEDQLNCGACGYANCREQAIAVLRGMAEPEMCIPHMRRVAEQRGDRIMETSPNGIVILNDRLEVLAMNPAFRRMFGTADGMLGKRLSLLMDPAPFEPLVSGEESKVELTASHRQQNVICREILYALPEERQFVGIFVNITPMCEQTQQLDRLRADTIAQARELLAHQVAMAQQMAQFLGQSTAQGEALVRNLVELARQDSGTER